MIKIRKNLFLIVCFALCLWPLVDAQGVRPGVNAEQPQPEEKKGAHPPAPASPISGHHRTTLELYGFIIETLDKMKVLAGGFNRPFDVAVIIDDHSCLRQADRIFTPANVQSLIQGHYKGYLDRLAAIERFAITRGLKLFNLTQASAEDPLSEGKFSPHLFLHDTKLSDSAATLDKIRQAKKRVREFGQSLQTALQQDPHLPGAEILGNGLDAKSILSRQYESIRAVSITLLCEEAYKNIQHALTNMLFLIRRVLGSPDDATSIELANTEFQAWVTYIGLIAGCSYGENKLLSGPGHWSRFSFNLGVTDQDIVPLHLLHAGSLRPEFLDSKQEEGPQAVAAVEDSVFSNLTISDAPDAQQAYNVVCDALIATVGMYQRLRVMEGTLTFYTNLNHLDQDFLQSAA